MEIQLHGANCLTLGTKQVRVVIDDNLVDLGAKSVTKGGDVALFTGVHSDSPADTKIVIGQPGEYEVSGISIYGIAARAHMDEEGKQTATIFKLVTEDLRILVVGHIYPELSDQQLEAIGMIDVMFVPVGNSGYTLDGVGAFKLVKKVEPKLIIPTHYEMKGIEYPVPQQPLEEALKAFSMEVKETVSKLKLKSVDLSDTAQLVVLERP